jgi:hypothetical protein
MLLCNNTRKLSNVCYISMNDIMKPKMYMISKSYVIHKRKVYSSSFNHKHKSCLSRYTFSTIHTNSNTVSPFLQKTNSYFMYRTEKEKREKIDEQDKEKKINQHDKGENRYCYWKDINGKDCYTREENENEEEDCCWKVSDEKYCYWRDLYGKDCYKK